MSSKGTFLAALKTMSPIIAGFVPTGMAYGLLCTVTGINPLHVILSSIAVFAGSAQFISIELIKQQTGLIQFGLIIFLINSRHLFYGVSVFDKFNKTGKAKPFMIFALTDEAYAIYTGTKTPEGVKEGLYYIFIACLGYGAWNLGTVLGVFASNFVKFDVTGLDFAMSALFIVIMVEQLKTFKSKLPFAIGAVTGLVSLWLIGSGGMLLGCAVGSTILLLAARKAIEGEER